MTRAPFIMKVIPPEKARRAIINAWLRELFWGPDLGRARRNLVLSSLFILILGQVAVSARPRLNAWLYPVPPPPPAVCTQRGISFGGVIPTGDVVAAKKWARIEGDILGQGYIWNEGKQRVELWLIEENALWILEFKCFAIVTPGSRYTATFGEFEMMTREDAVAWDKELKAAEMGE